MVDVGIVRLGFAGGVLVGGLLSLSLALRLAARGLFGPPRAVRLPRRLPPVERTLLLLLVCGLVQYGATKGTGGDSPARPPVAAADAVVCAGGMGEGVRSKEKGAGDEGVSSREKGVSAESSSSVVAGDKTQEDVAHHTYSLLPTTYSLSLSDADISRGYRLVSVVTNEAYSYTMSADARLVGTWHLTDAYDAAARVFLDGSFPLGGQVVTSLWAHVWGRARPQLWNASNEIVAVGAPMFARRGVSRLWTAATTNGSALLTWQDFFFKGVSSKEQGTGGKGVSSKEKGVSAEFSSSVVAVDGTQLDVDHHTYSLISAQLELFRDGSFVARSNSVARAYRRVNPDDWDGDGIPNDEDDDPRVAADEPRFGPRQSLPPGAHTNNYFWIDLVVRDADALVSFAGDAPSDLPDPSFIARAGETNRVTLLIGKRYAVSCRMPVSVVGTSSDAIEVRQETDGTLRLLWPVEIGVMEGDGDEEACAGGGGEGVSSKEQVVSAEFSSSSVAVGGTEKDGNDHTYSSLLPPYSLSAVAACGTQQDVAHHTYSLLLAPYSLSHRSLLLPPYSLSHRSLLLPPYSLNATPSSFTMALSPPWLVGAFAWTNSCCRVAGDGLAFSFACGGECMCGGCAATGYFAYEGYRLPARGGACPCGGSGGAVVPGDEGDEEPNPLPGASAWFSKRVILFEDEYEDAPGVTVPWRSTETELDCRASGGPNGGRVRIEARGVDGLVPYGGRPLPFERELEPFEEVAFRNTYRAVRPSGGEGDIVVTATFEENGTGAAWTSEDRATAVRVRLRPEVYAPRNECPYRHRVGIGEVVNCEMTPTVQGVTFAVSGRGRYLSASGQYVCPLKAEQNTLSAVGGGAEYVPQMEVVEPSAVGISDVSFESLGLPAGHAGGIALRMRLHAWPLDVSFQNVKIEEIPDVRGTRGGYFADSFFMRDWYHGEEQGAGDWFAVIADNEFLLDVAGLVKEMPQLDACGFVSPVGTNGWTAGTLTWNVPCGWGDVDAERGDEPVGAFSNEALQVMTIDAEGNCEVRKHGNSVSRTIHGLIRLNGETR